MTKIWNILFGRGNKISGLLAMGIIAAVALGCTCAKDLNLGDLGKNSESNTSRTASNTSTTKSDSTDYTVGSKPDASKGLIPPDDDELQYLARQTMVDFNDAIAKADFNYFHSTICKPWQKQVSADEMKNMFQRFIDGKASFGEVSTMDATLTTRKVRKEGSYKILEVNGEYPTSPNTTSFELNYLAEGSDWKLSKIKVETTINLQ
jgi:hypothetical protein